MVNRWHRTGIALALALAGTAACSDGGGNGADAPAADALTPVDSGPVELESAPDQPIGSYTNGQHRFTIAVPDGWVELRAAANEDGSIFESRTLDSDLRVHGSSNEGDADFEEAIEALRDSTTNADGAMVGTNEYRGAATDPEGYRIELRLLRRPGGGMVSALVRYPVDRAGELAPIAARTLDSLTLN